MCSSCGTQNNETNSRSRVFSVRRNISSWSDVADLILSCIAVGKPSQQFFDLDTEILHFLEGKMNNLKLPRHVRAFLFTLMRRIHSPINKFFGHIVHIAISRRPEEIYHTRPLYISASFCQRKRSKKASVAVGIAS